MAHLQQTPFDATRKVWYAPNKFEAYGEPEIEAVVECLRAGWLAGFGPRTQRFEEQVAEKFGKRWGLFVNSGSAACLLAVGALNLPKGAEVVTPACTFSTTVAPLCQLGLRPVFCDVQLAAYVPSVEQVLEKVTPNTRAVMLPNLIGNLPDWPALRAALDAAGRKDVALIEDSADTIYKSASTDIATTSFYASHLITAGGSGGMVMFNDEAQLKRATMYRDWGRIGNNSEDLADRFEHAVDGIPYDFKFLYGVQGYNFKSSEMNAAFGLKQLERLDSVISTRRALVERYTELLQGSSVLLPDDSKKPNWLAMPLQHKQRAKLLIHLENAGIQTRVCFAGNVTRHPAYREFLSPFENSDTIMANAFLLGAHHGMQLSDVDYVCETIRTWERTKME